MCGITGFLNPQQLTPPDTMEAVVRRMARCLAHRGPDDEGVWVDAQAGVALGHRRLSIVDLSPEGHQPMVSASGRYVIVFNGEIYNFQELRNELDSKPRSTPLTFRGHSDTEVMLAAFEWWGVEGALERFNGMFAFALWDRHERRLYLGRDRFGEKPLYYGWAGRVFLFGSELKSLRAHPDFHNPINRDALALFFHYGYIGAPYSIYEGIHKIPPACLLAISTEHNNTPAPAEYWSFRGVAEAAKSEPLSSGTGEAVEQIERVLREAVKLRMVADVPLGALLSGGIDSSTVVALMQAQSSRPVRTFTIGFHEGGYNEAVHAAAVAKHLGTDHTELYVTPGQAMEVVPRLPALYDEPFADSSQIPTFVVCGLARQHVTVGLSGDGGDEVFGGYNRYFWGPRIWKMMRWIPKALRKKAAAAVSLLSPEAWETAFLKAGPWLPRIVRQRNPGEKVHKLAEIVGVETPEAMYGRLVSYWKGSSSLVLHSTEPPTPFTDRSQWAEVPDFTERMMFLDTITYLPDDILAKVDRASMGVSLETRIPYLDPRVVECAWKIPLSLKIRNGQGKWILRQILYKYVPQELVERPKAGFAIPLANWLRGPLRGWSESLLNERRLAEGGFFDPLLIRSIWSQHLAGKGKWALLLWCVLMFQAWLEVN